ncbi:protein of unknown function [Candidatus Methylocalor cossyra]|uniref:Uncharacterized protein n=1 Tax=Candidatus Methylocalor cossyra TaxID=3108543 RepID=A0ABP1C822_9GAMM
MTCSMGVAGRPGGGAAWAAALAVWLKAKVTAIERLESPNFSIALMFDLVEVGMRSIRGRHSARDRTFLKRERLSLLARRPMLGVDFEGPMKIEWQNLFPSPVFLPAASMQAPRRSCYHNFWSFAVPLEPVA